MATSPGTSVPTLFGFSHPVSGSCGISGYAHVHVSPRVACVIAFRTSTAALFGTALNQPCILPVLHLRTALTRTSSFAPFSYLSLSMRMHVHTQPLAHFVLHALPQEALTGAVLNARANGGLTLYARNFLRCGGT